MIERDVDVCVVGAGFAGLAAARHLVSEGRTVAVLEARGRVGGRVWGKTLGDGTTVSVGGTWLGKDQARMFDLVGKVGLGVYPQYDDGDLLMRLDGRNAKFGELASDPAWWWALACLGIAYARLNEMAAGLPLDRPWDAPGARELDAQTLEGWISSWWNVPSERARTLLRTTLGLLFSSDLSLVSLLGGMVLARGGRGDGFLYYIDASITETHLVDGGGTPEVARRLGEELGGALHTSAPVRRIAHTDGGVEVVADGVTVRAGYVIVTAPPVLAGEIEYDPPLPDAYGHLMRGMPAGAIFRVVTVYDRPFWRDAGLSGQSAAPQSPVAVSIDQSPPSPTTDAPPPRGILSSYAIGPKAVEMAAMDPDRRKELWLRELAVRFGDEAAGRPLDYVETDWSAEEWSKGGMISHFAPGVLTSYGQVLHEPHGRIYWAGTERATEMHGLMEGAVRSGEQAAQKIVHRLRGE
ncbi:MAG TPA: FAD-dependent oxidoreductase [Longimicrobiaceae bacterium]|jgi:monoamine oxidase|nr:FAD-dependent oxidoreductase [Longimicrobiaceae bacterium]